MDKAVKDSGPGLIGMLMTYRSLLATTDSRKKTIKKFKKFAEYKYGPFMYIAARRFGDSWRWRSPSDCNKLWKELEKIKGFELKAKKEQVTTLYYKGRYDDATDALEELFQLAKKLKKIPPLDQYSYYAVLYSSRGASGWSYFMAELKKLARELEVSEGYILLIYMSQLTGDMSEQERIIAQIPPKLFEQKQFALDLSAFLVSYGRPKLALNILNSRVQDRAQDGTEELNEELLYMLSTIAEQSGQFKQAESYLRQALSARPTRPMALSELRQTYSRLYSLSSRQALGTFEKTERAAAVTRTLATSNEWKIYDSDNSYIDIETAKFCYAIGNHQEAWRYLSSILDRHPGEAEYYAEVAGVLEKRGEFSRAEQLWIRATELEPTNPTWILNLARLKLNTGSKEDAKKLVIKITEKRWQDRFSSVVYQARQLKKRLAK